MSYGFHAKNGLFFDKDKDGNVIIRKARAETVMFEVILDPDSWASVVASVSARGENHKTFSEARRFHIQRI